MTTRTTLRMLMGGLALLTLAALPVLAEQNIVKNGSMELGPGPMSEDPHVPAGWTRFGPTVERSAEANLVPEGAGHALKAFSSDPQVGAYQDVPATPGQQVQISASLYTRANDRLTGDAQAWIILEFFNASNQNVGFNPLAVLDASSPADTWVPASVGPIAAPANTAYARMTCVWTWNGSAGGSAFWDDCQLTINAGPNQLVNGDFETAGQGANSPTGIDEWQGFNDQQKSQDFAYDGVSSVKIGMGQPFSGLFQNMDTLTAGDRLLLVARVFQSSANPLVSSDRAGIKLEFFPPGGGSLPPPTETLSVSENSPQDQWIPVELSMSGIEVPNGAGLARVVMIFVGNSNTTGAVFFDTAFAGTPAGLNRLLNASFESGTGGANGITNWTEFGSGGATARKSLEVAAHSGDFTVKATGPEVTGVRQDVSVTPGETINVSAFLYISPFEPLAGTGVAGVKVEWVAGSIPTNVDITPGPSNNTITAASPKDEWIELFIDYTMPPGTEAGVRFVTLVARSGGTVGAAYFDACEAVVMNRFDGSDVDNDDDQDLRDFADFQRTFSGDGVPATKWLATVFDHDEDGDVDLTDWAFFSPRMTGPDPAN